MADELNNGPPRKVDLDDTLGVVSFERARSAYEATGTRKGILLRAFAWRRRMPRRAWVYGNVLQRGYINAIAAPGGLGKTALCVVHAIALASGRCLLGEIVHHPCRAGYFSLEGDP